MLQAKPYNQLFQSASKKKKRGRPKKKQTTGEPQPEPELKQTLLEEFPPEPPTITPVKVKKTRINWSQEPHRTTLVTAIDFWSSIQKRKQWIMKICVLTR